MIKAIRADVGPERLATLAQNGPIAASIHVYSNGTSSDETWRSTSSSSRISIAGTPRTGTFRFACYFYRRTRRIQTRCISGSIRSRINNWRRITGLIAIDRAEDRRYDIRSAQSLLNARLFDEIWSHNLPWVELRSRCFLDDTAGSQTAGYFSLA